MNNNTIMRVLFLCFAFCTSHFTLLAQDLRVSQFENAPLLLNPALTGNIDGNHRASIMHRNQRFNALGDDSYTSTILAFDTRLDLPNDNYFGLGINGIFESSGSLEYTVNKLSVSGSYSKTILKNNIACHSLQGGIDIALTKRGINLTDARWPSQHDGNGGFDPDLPGGDIEDDPVFHGDLGIGFSWMSRFTNGVRFNVGASFYHITEPTVSFVSVHSSVNTLTSIHSSLHIPVSSLLSIRPAFAYYEQSNHKDAIFGITSYWHLNKQENTNLEFGFWINDNFGVPNTIVPNSHVAYGAVQFDKVKLGYSYTFAGATQFDDSFEVLVQYTFDTNSKLCNIE